MTRFAAGQVDALFEAVLIDDVIDETVVLPPHTPRIEDARILADCFALARQLWEDGVDPVAFNALLGRLVREGDLSADDRLAYKYARARFKHLRFAFVLYGVDHRSPALFKWVTTLQGHLQDAFRNRRHARARSLALLLRGLLSGVGWGVLHRQARTLRVDDADGFARFVERQFQQLRESLDQNRLSGEEFHASRKIVSRYVSFVDTLRTLRPDEATWQMSRYLSAINGLMGALHDDLVEAHASGTGDYHRDAVELPSEIAARLQALLVLFPER